MRRKLIKVALKRRREGKTDYKFRSNVLKTALARLVVRKTNRYIIAQIVESKEAQDFTVVYANSKELNKFGWHYSHKNIPAAYLTGLLIAQKAKKKKIKEAIFDIGLQRSTKGGKIYAVVKGCVDNELKINYSEKIAPSEDRIKGLHTQAKDNEKILNEIKEKIKKL